MDNIAKTKFSGRSSPYLLSAPLARLANKVFGKAVSAIADSQEVLCPGHRFFHPPAIYDEAELTRVTGTAETSTVANEISRAKGDWVQHGPSVAYTVKNMLLCNGTFYAPRYKHNVTLENGPLLRAGMAEWAQGGVLSQCWLGSKYFGHSLHDEVPMAMLASQRGRVVGIKRNMTPQQVDYAHLFGLQVESLPELAWIEQMEILDDYAYSPSKIERWRAMRSMFSNAADTPKHPGVVLLRGDTGQNRVLLNENEVVEYFLKLGFKAINPGTSDLRAVMRAVSGARIVVGVEGSQMVHGWLGVADHGAMLVLQPPFRFDNAYKTRCDLLGLTYSFLIAHEAPGGFKVEMDQLGRALDRVENKLSRT